MRKNPIQSRAHQTFDDILEATAQLLESGRSNGLNTNRVAERAGVSIGTLYYYFPNKVSLLRSLALREVDRQEKLFLAAIAGARADGPSAMIRAIVREALTPLKGRRELRRRLIGHDGFDPSVRTALHAALSRVTDSLIAASGLDPVGISRERRFMLLRSMLGPIRAAALYEPEMLSSRQFEDELVRHAMRLLLADQEPQQGR